MVDFDMQCVQGIVNDFGFVGVKEYDVVVDCVNVIEDYVQVGFGDEFYDW